MDTYLMMLYVSLDQEKALKKFFVDKGWKYRKPDPSHYTDQLGPIKGSISVKDEPYSSLPKITSAHSKSAPSARPLSTVLTRSKRKNQTENQEDVANSFNSYSSMEVVDDDDLKEYMNDGDDDDDFVDDYVNEDMKMKSYVGEDKHMAKLDGTIEEFTVMTSSRESSGNEDGEKNESDGSDTNRMPEASIKVDQETQTTVIDSKDSLGFLISDVNQVNVMKFETMPDEQKGMRASSATYDESLPYGPSVLHHESFKYVCKVCGKAYVKKSSLSRHLMSHKPGMLRCSACNWYFKDAGKMEEHNSKFHATTYACDECGTSMSRKSSLRKHMLRVHPEVCQAKFTCFFSPCKSVFDSESLYKDHLNIHEGKRPHKCTECDKSFASMQSLKFHIMNHSKDSKSSQCEDCGKVFQGHGALHNHKMSVHEQKRYKCELCDKEFMYRSGYSKHLLSHKKEKSQKKLGISSSGVKLRDLKILAGLGEKGVNLLTGSVGKANKLITGLHTDSKILNKNKEDLLKCVGSTCKQPSNILLKSQNSNDKNVDGLASPGCTELIEEKQSAEAVCTSLNVEDEGQAVADTSVVVETRTSAAVVMETRTSVADTNSQISYLGEPVFSGTASIQGIPLAQSGQIVWICQN